MTIKPTDIVLVCAHNEDEFNSLQASVDLHCRVALAFIVVWFVFFLFLTTRM
jgi:hypothetical protein